MQLEPIYRPSNCIFGLLKKNAFVVQFQTDSIIESDNFL